MTIEEVFPAVQGVLAALVQGGVTSDPDPSNPCTEASAGLLYCDGTGMAVLPFPTGAGPWAVQVVNGAPVYANAAGTNPAGVQGGEPTDD